LNILVIIAHPDDEVLGMGGTILKHAKNGDRVTVAYLTTGITSRRSINYKTNSKYEPTKKQEDDMQKQIKELRSDAKRACKFLKVKKTMFFDYPDNELDTIPLLRIIKTVEKLVKETKPERIYTSHFGDLNIDHRIVYESVLTAVRPTELTVKEILCFELLSSTEWSFSYEFKPNYFIDIKNELENKIKAMKLYKNEIRKYPHPRSVESIKHTACKWGTVSGFFAAEAFQLIRKFEK
jgi:LmbE family N-acetylglucosaminyl deacetylase